MRPNAGMSRTCADGPHLRELAPATPLSGSRARWHGDRTRRDSVLMRSPLAEIAARAGLSVDDDTGPERVICSYAARWPGVTFAVAAEAELLETALAAAAADVPDLWPGRAVEDGAMSLLA